MNQNRGNDHRKAAERICHDVQKHTMQVLVVVVATVAVRMAVVFIVVKWNRDLLRSDSCPK